ncbi:hypothetical protein [Arthrobacter agilis]|uniref:hypothetical protein n=1 Tax=Arthrobacter agilis TaxID=37921 RepID=UPI00277E2548|nr:hypothetical protein [Arthrobacter agilis]MDQ0734870.1 uncharacterized protein YbjT (DUF2867 family) [Arthrobacter agilis]
MHVFIIGVSGAVGGLLAERLIERGDRVSGLVRAEEQQRRLAELGIAAHLGDLAGMTPEDLAHPWS